MDAMNLSGDGRVSLEQFWEITKGTEEHWEFHDGYPICQASPSRVHQGISYNISRAFGDFFDGKPCRPHLPRDVQLWKKYSPKGKLTPVFAPDMLVLCDQSKDDGQTIIGAPDLVVEIWSPSNTQKERSYKIRMYKEAGVQEIWEVFPDKEVTAVHTYDSSLQDYSTMLFRFNEHIESVLFHGLVVLLGE